MKPLIVIFGITGDLSRRKLIPALSAIAESGTVDEFEVLGISRRELEVGELVGETLAPRTSSMTMDLSDAQAYEQLAKRCEINNDRSVIFYLSVPPLAVEPITRSLARAGFSRPNVKLLLEKPFGIDEVSAREMATLLSESFDETQLYRIDHYLAKEMAQNIIAFRAGNAMFAHMWNHDIIDRVEIDAIEKIDIEGRGEFYEQTGAMRDVMQGHLIQLLSLVLCDLPEDLTWLSMPRLRARALSKIAPVLPQESIRAQYEGYDEEVKNPGSRTETFVSVELHSDDPRWQGVELRLTTGKSLDEKNDRSPTLHEADAYG
jgi:glucose-6-phosphate 1-dehydrogenase